MSLIGHTITLLLLLFLSSEMGAIPGAMGQHLKLPGSNIATLTPIFVLCVYLVGVVLEKSRKWSRLIWILIVPIMLYPWIIYICFSHSIVTPGAMSSNDFERFKSEFRVPVDWTPQSAAFQITVAARDFRPEMVTWLRELSDVARTKPPQDAPVQHPQSPSQK